MSSVPAGRSPQGGTRALSVSLCVVHCLTVSRSVVHCLTVSRSVVHRLTVSLCVLNVEQWNQQDCSWNRRARTGHSGTQLDTWWQLEGRKSSVHSRTPRGPLRQRKEVC